MGKQILYDIANSDIFTQECPNAIHGALKGTVIGRNSDGDIVPDQRLGNGTYDWLNAYFKNIYVGNVLMTETALRAPASAILDGRKRGLSNQSNFLLPTTGLNAVIRSSTAPLIYKASGEFIKIQADIPVTGLTAAPSTNNTVKLNTTVAGERATMIYGEINGGPGSLPSIPVTLMGSSVSARIGSYQAFDINGELMIAFIFSTSALRYSLRGFFFDSNENPIKREVLNSIADLFILHNLAWVFLDKDGSTVEVIYDQPAYSGIAPLSPSSGDYWWDWFNQIWMRYNGASWIDSEKVLVGWLAISDTACVGARSVDFFKLDEIDTTMRLEKIDDTALKSIQQSSFTKIGNTFLNPVVSDFRWNEADNFAPATDTDTTSFSMEDLYFLYLDDEGRPYISDLQPYYQAFHSYPYHPFNPWRCIGLIWNDTSVIDSVDNFANGLSEQIPSINAEHYGTITNNGQGVGVLDWIAYNPHASFQNDYKGSHIEWVASQEEYRIMTSGFYSIFISMVVYNSNDPSGEFSISNIDYQANLVGFTSMGRMYAQNGVSSSPPPINRQYHDYHSIYVTHKFLHPYNIFGYRMSYSAPWSTFPIMRGISFNVQKRT